jgi:uncharacterized integral membrane protein (TIGR00698 family)
MTKASDTVAPPSPLSGLVGWAAGLAPGVLLCALITLISYGLAYWEASVFGYAYVEALVFAIVLGIVVRSNWTPGRRWSAGIAFSGKMLLEIAVVLLGASMSMAAIMASGPTLLVSILLLVTFAIIASYTIGRALGLSQRLSILIACGNSICGNSAIVAVAPVIGADAKEITSSIAFTAVLGVILVLSLPLLVPILEMTNTQYGVLAGLTVYAVPQVLAATLPVSTVSAQLGTLVKLVRVLMLAPVVIFFSIIRPRLEGGGEPALKNRPGLLRLVPWFIVGFLLLAAARSLGVIPTVAHEPILTAAKILTVISMAALGLGVDIRVVAKVGVRVTSAVVLSLVVLIAIAFGLIHVLHVA